MKKGIAEGEARGITNGEKLAKIETAKNLLKMGLSVSQIASAIGLAENDIQDLIKKLPQL